MSLKMTSVIKMDADHPDMLRLREIARSVRFGKVVVFPTETVYGIGLPMDDEKSSALISQIKGRDPQKPYAYHIGDLGMLEHLEVTLDSKIRFLADKFWPGPVTLIVNNRRGVATGIRFPKTPITQELIRSVGVPLIASSANKSGEPSPKTAEEVLELLKQRAKEKIELNQTFILKLMLPEGYFQEREIHFEGKSLWSSNDINPDFFDTGFEVTSLSTEERKIIRKMIEQIGFNY